MPEPKLVEAVAREPEMVRRVAEAMFEGYRSAINDSLGPKWAPYPWAELDGASKRYFCAAAREGIQAMRNRSGALCVPGGLAIEGALFSAENKTAFDGARDCFDAMIDAALAAPDEGEGP